MKKVFFTDYAQMEESECWVFTDGEETDIAISEYDLMDYLDCDSETMESLKKSVLIPLTIDGVDHYLLSNIFDYLHKKKDILDESSICKN